LIKMTGQLRQHLTSALTRGSIWRGCADEHPSLYVD
jgi:hypothetical protein